MYYEVMCEPGLYPVLARRFFSLHLALEYQQKCEYVYGFPTYIRTRQRKAD